MSWHESGQQGQQSTRVLVLPRPNLGPEAWSEDASNVVPLLSAGIALFVLLAGAIGIFWYRRRRSGRRTSKASPTEAQPVNRADQLLILANQIREDLAAGFGPCLRAQTTEEIAADLQLKKTLGADQFEAMIRLLSLADHRKFAALPENGDQQAILDEIAAWTTLRTDLAVRLAARPQRGTESP